MPRSVSANPAGLVPEPETAGQSGHVRQSHAETIPHLVSLYQETVLNESAWGSRTREQESQGPTHFVPVLHDVAGVGVGLHQVILLVERLFGQILLREERHGSPSRTKA